MYSINNPSYFKSFPTIDELINDMCRNGIDLDQELLFDDEPTGENCLDYCNF